MNDQGVQTESEFVFRRLTETFKLLGTNKEVDGRWWLLILAAVLLVGIGFVVWMYIKDSRSVRWYWAAPLALLRTTVYLLLALMFLMPARQGYERVEKRSRVIILLDVSDSMAQLSDEPASARGAGRTRLAKVMDYLSDEKIGFVKALLDKNPVYVYRFGNRFDEDAQIIERDENGQPVPIHRVAGADAVLKPVSGRPWKNDDWQAFASYDFKPWLLRGLSDEGATRLKVSGDWDGNAVGNAEWAEKWLEKNKSNEGFPAGLNPDDLAVLASNRDKLRARIDVARSIGTGTNVPDSLLALVNRETGNMVQGIVVFSDGQSNLGSESAVQELRVRASREKIPVFTVAVGSEQKTVAVRITDVQAPDQTPPNEPFKVIIEQDGDGLVGQKAQIFLEIQLPKEGTPPIRIPAEATYQPGEPPHTQAEIVIDPEKVPEELKNKDNPKEMVEGEWKLRAVTPRVEGERFADKEHVSDWVAVKVQKKPQRVLVMCSAPNRDVQFLITQLLRDKADMSLLIQNAGGTEGKINLLEEKERQLTHFPDVERFRVEDVPNENPDTKWYNLARYDVIIAFDVDWDQLTAEQTKMIKTWVDLQAGGLLFVAGHIHTHHLSRPTGDDKFEPLIDILPVLPGDPFLAAAKRTANQPWPLEFENIGGDLDFMKLDDSHQNVETAWNMFFTGREEKDEKARILRGFFNYFPLRDMKPVATPVARFPDPNAIKMPDGKSPPWMAVMQYGQGRTAWIGSPEIWRLRQYKDEYFERFWTKFIRYLGAGSRRKVTRRGRILMSQVVPVGGYIRPNVQELDASLQPLDPKSEPKIVFRPVELEKYPAEIEALKGDDTIAKAKEKYHAKFTHEFRMTAKKGPDKWEGYFQKTVLASAEKFPPGSWRAEAEIPSSTEVLKYKFLIRQSNPELDVTRPDLKALYQIASPLSEMQVSDAALAADLKKRTATGNEGNRLAFRFGDEDSLRLIPDCFKTDRKTFRNRGAVEDYWDKGVTLPHFLTGWFSEKPQRLGIGLLLCVGLLSIEWLTRKLLKLA
jgi:hypothetical protein